MFPSNEICFTDGKQKTCPFGQVRSALSQYGSSNKRCLFVHETELLLETIYTSAGIHEFLLAREKRMALGANFNTDVALGRTGFDYLAAGTSDSSLLIVGMDSFLHRFHLSSRVNAVFLYASSSDSKYYFNTQQ